MRDQQDIRKLRHLKKTQLRTIKNFLIKNILVLRDLRKRIQFNTKKQNQNPLFLSLKMKQKYLKEAVSLLYLLYVKFHIGQILKNLLQFRRLIFTVTFSALK